MTELTIPLRIEQTCKGGCAGVSNPSSVRFCRALIKVSTTSQELEGTDRTTPKTALDVLWLRQTPPCTNAMTTRHMTSAHFNIFRRCWIFETAMRSESNWGSLAAGRLSFLGSALVTSMASSARPPRVRGASCLCWPSLHHQKRLRITQPATAAGGQVDPSQ